MPTDSATLVRAAFAVVMGFAATVFLVTLGTAIAVRRAKVTWGSPTPRYLVANLVLSLLAAGAGGYTSTRLAPGHSLMPAIILGAIFLVSGAFSARKGPSPGQPAWYPLGITGILLAGIALGAFLP